MEGILKMNKLLFAALIALSCEPTHVSIPEQDTAPQEDSRNWVTWDVCGHNVDENPCNFVLADQNGKEIELYDFYGKVIVIDFSTMWCTVCVNIASEGDKLIAKYGAERVVWLTVLIENESGEAPDLSDLQRWVAAHSIMAPVLGGDRSFIDMSATTGYPITGWPTIVVINQKMVLKRGISGWSEQAIMAWVDELLQT
jgi:thiol-disulfide isomerase/thioredoxin